MLQPKKSPYSRAIFILFDGSRPDVFDALLSAGRLPQIQRHLLGGGARRAPATSL